MSGQAAGIVEDFDCQVAALPADIADLVGAALSPGSVP